MHPIQFFAFLIFTVIAFWGVSYPFPASLVPVLFVFVGIPLFDAAIGVDKKNPTKEEENLWKLPKVWGPALYLFAFTHVALIFYGASTVYHTTSWMEVLLLAFVVGLYTGGLGITVGHELCHKKEKLPRFVADLLLSSVWYQHFAVEHVRGHHLMVSTPEDPASARLNENVYAFVIRSIKDSFKHALKIDQKKVLIGISLSALWTLVSALFGWKVFVFFIFQGITGFVLLELVNYLEHYGLSRKALGNGRYEKVTPIHSWNSAHKFSNLLLFNLQRHSDHHALAHLPYTILKHHDEAPQLPSGYPGMILLALIPPLWFKVMNPKVEHWKMRHISVSESSL
ncbi:MAG: alkane 1-monooxygenase [Bacteriovoracaceae bacterium]|nr:alkane 1-monooxygenase [Bacteriovoracaceae bacterium]